jgi:origin recognition complex subunit 2
MSAKRKRAESNVNGTPSKRSRHPDSDHSLEDELSTAEAAFDTPTKALKQRRGILVNGTATPRKSGIDSEVATPRSQRRVFFSTPAQNHEDDDHPEPEVNGTPTIVRNADSSARRKSARRLLEQSTGGDGSDDDAEEDILAQRIWDEEAGIVEDSSGDEEAPAEEIVVDLAATPTKRGRGRPRLTEEEKERRAQLKRRSPTPPQDLPAHERYFYDNRPAGNKTSNNTLAAHELLNHEEYFELMQAYKEPHAEEMEALLLLHERAFDQWIFELENGFNICLYGYGSKRELVDRFAHHLHDHLTETGVEPRIVVVNGYNSSLTPRDILLSILTAIAPKSSLPTSTQPAALLSHLQQVLTSKTPVHLLINSLDAPPLRRSTTQTILTALAAQPHLSLLATTDTSTFPLLWDLGARSALRFLFHDATTLSPLQAEVGDVVETVRSLLGRAGRRGVAGRDGVAFVLRSLPENARGLFRLLIGEQLAAADVADDAARIAGGGDDADEEEGEGGAAAGAREGVEWGTLYHKAVEEFVCSNEMTFRTLLKEFLDHQMIEVRRDALGAERLVAPFRRDELEGLLEELVGM